MASRELSDDAIAPAVIQVLVVDDHVILAEEVNSYLSTAPDIEVVGVAANAAQALQRLRHHQVDVVVLDYRLPDVTGDELARMMLAQWPALRIVMVTANGDDSVAAAAIAAGCHGFLPKGRSGAVLMKAVRDVHAGIAVFDPTTVVRAIPFLRRRGPTVHTTWDLTDRERQVLTCLGEGLTTTDIATRLEISPVTVRNHIQRILTKLDAHSRLEAVSMGIRAGVVPAFATPGIDAAPEPSTAT